MGKNTGQAYGNSTGPSTRVSRGEKSLIDANTRGKSLESRIALRYHGLDVSQRRELARRLQKQAKKILSHDDPDYALELAAFSKECEFMRDAKIKPDPLHIIRACKSPAANRLFIERVVKLFTREIEASNYYYARAKVALKEATSEVATRRIQKAPMKPKKSERLATKQRPKSHQGGKKRLFGRAKSRKSL